jgi:hypothetical protein
MIAPNVAPPPKLLRVNVQCRKACYKGCSPLNREVQAFFAVPVVTLFVRLVELTPTFFLYVDIATPAGPIVR